MKNCYWIFRSSVCNENFWYSNVHFKWSNCIMNQCFWYTKQNIISVELFDFVKNKYVWEFHFQQWDSFLSPIYLEIIKVNKWVFIFITRFSKSKNGFWVHDLFFVSYMWSENSSKLKHVCKYRKSSFICIQAIYWFLLDECE